MARINVTRLPLPTDKYDRSQQDILIRELENMEKSCIVKEVDKWRRKM